MSLICINKPKPQLYANEPQCNTLFFETQRTMQLAQLKLAGVYHLVVSY